MMSLSMPDVTPDAKKKIADAYAAFEKSLRDIAHEHRLTVSDLLHQVDEKCVDKLKERIEKESDRV